MTGKIRSVIWLFPLVLLACSIYDFNFDNELDPNSPNFIGYDGVIESISGLYIYENDKSLELSWNSARYPNDWSRLFTIYIYRSTDSVPTYGEGSLVYTGKDSSYSDKDVKDAESYYYSVFACSEDGSKHSGAQSISGKLGGSVSSEGLVAEYLFDGDANDSSENDNNGTVNGASLTSDRFGNPDKAYSFDGEDDWIEYSTNDFKLNEITFSLWIKTSDVSSHFFNYTKNNGYYGYTLFVNEDGNCQTNIVASDGGALSTVSGTATLNDSKWHHIVVVKDLYGNFSLFQDNEKFSISDSNDAIFDSDMYLYIGASRPNFNYHPSLSFAQLDDVRIYNRALSEEEIEALYKEGGWTGSQTSFTVTYDANGADSGTVPVDSTHYGKDDKVTIQENTGILVKEGYRFIGWNTKADGSGTNYESEDILTIADKDVILYAAWSKLCSITYNANDADSGSVPIDSGKYIKGEKVIVLGNTGSLAKNEYLFNGWNTKADGRGSSYKKDDTFFMEEEDLILYAKWDVDSIPKNGLIAEYLFSGNANDSSEKNNNGTVNGSALTSDRFGNADKAYSFDGVDDYIEYSNDWFSEVNSVISICGWFYINSSEDSLGTIIGQRLNKKNNDFLISTHADQKRYLFTHWSGPANTDMSYSYSSDNIYAKEKWVFFYLTSNQSTVKFSIDGKLIEEKNLSGNNSSQGNRNLIGGWRYDNGSMDAFFNGKIDDVRIYNRALIDDEIKNLYKEGGWTGS